MYNWISWWPFVIVSSKSYYAIIRTEERCTIELNQVIINDEDKHF